MNAVASSRCRPPDAGRSASLRPSEVAPSSRQWVDHSEGEHAPGDVTSNRAENYFSHFGSLDGTYHHVSVQAPSRYLAELDYRYSMPKLRHHPN